MSQGIFGTIDFDRPIANPTQIGKTMGRFLENDLTGRSGIDYLFNTHYVLGMKRSKLEKNQTDVIAEDRLRQIICLMHGETHNDLDKLKKTISGPFKNQGDLELFAALYRRKGIRFVQQLNGLFTIGILDKKNKLFILCNDRFGLAHQVYWTVRGKCFYFATHLKALLACPEIKRHVNIECLNLFLKYAYIPSPRTIFKGIHKLPPGYVLSFKEGKTDVRRSWEFKQPCDTNGDIVQAGLKYEHLLKRSIARRLSSQGDIGILLSGGLDSSANVALAAECTDRKIKTFSVGFDNPQFDERPYARIVANHFQTHHHEYTVTGHEIDDLPRLIWHLEEPYFEFGLFLTYLGMAAAQKKVDTIIGGEGADQLFGTGGFAGALPVVIRFLIEKSRLMIPAAMITRQLKGALFYEKDNLAFKIRLLFNRIIDLNNWYFYGFDQNELNRLHAGDGCAELPVLFNNKLDRKTSFDQFYSETLINQDLWHYVNENIMVKAGRMADMLGLSLRESYLDTEVVDYLTSLTLCLKRKGSLLDHLRGKFKTKYLHRKAMETILPLSIQHKPKQGGFVPIMLFLRDDERRNNVYKHLLASESLNTYFNRSYIRLIIENFERWKDKPVYWPNFLNAKASRLLFLLTFDIWHTYYVENNPLHCDIAPLRYYLKK